MFVFYINNMVKFHQQPPKVGVTFHSVGSSCAEEAEANPIKATLNFTYKGEQAQWYKPL